MEFGDRRHLILTKLDRISAHAISNMGKSRHNLINLLRRDPNVGIERRLAIAEGSVGKAIKLFA